MRGVPFAVALIVLGDVVIPTALTSTLAIGVFLGGKRAAKVTRVFLMDRKHSLPNSLQILSHRHHHDCAFQIRP